MAFAVPGLHVMAANESLINLAALCILIKQLCQMATCLLYIKITA